MKEAQEEYTHQRGGNSAQSYQQGLESSNQTREIKNKSALN